MEIESVSKKYLNPAIKAMALIFIVMALIQLFMSFQLNKQQKELKKKEVSSTIMSLQSVISEKIAIIASSQVFIDYLRSGKISREKLELDIRIMFSSLKEDSILGLSIYDNEMNNLILVGEATTSDMRVPVCYLNNTLNFEFGRCIGFLGISYSIVRLEQKIIQMNPNLEQCRNCDKLYFDDNSFFGSFKALPQRKVPLSFKIKGNNYLLNFAFIELVFFLAVVIIFFILHKTFQSVSSNYIYKPIKALAASIGKGEISKPETISIFEIRYLAECLNKYLVTFKEQEALKSKAKLGEIAKKVAHDIRSPLSVIEILLGDNDSLSEEDSKVLKSSLESIHVIANDLLATSRNTAVVENIQSVQLLFPVLEDVIEEVKTLLRSNAKIKVDLIKDSRDVLVKINRIELKRVISNIINNSIDAFPTERGEITVSCSIGSELVKIEIRDNGIGIPPNVLSQLFTTSVSVGKNDGNGIGLVSAKEVIDNFSGQILIDSVVGKGTSVTIFLPVV